MPVTREKSSAHQVSVVNSCQDYQVSDKTPAVYLLEVSLPRANKVQSKGSHGQGGWRFMVRHLAT